jgi:hypothetical protein
MKRMRLENRLHSELAAINRRVAYGVATSSDRKRGRVLVAKLYIYSPYINRRSK